MTSVAVKNLVQASELLGQKLQDSKGWEVVPIALEGQYLFCRADDETSGQTGTVLRRPSELTPCKLRE